MANVESWLTSVAHPQASSGQRGYEETSSNVASGAG